MIDGVAQLIGVVVVLSLFGDSDRPWAAAALAWLVVTAYEAILVARFGATLGKLAVGQRVVALDRVGRPDLATATRRAAVDGAFTVMVVVGWIIWAVSSLTDALGRGIADRAAGTFVVPKGTALPIAARDLAGYADGARAPRVSALGRVGDLDVRTRARIRRIVDAPALAAAVGLLALVAALPVSTGAFLLASSAAWIVVFVIDETIRIHRRAATAGHRMAGLVVVDRRTGQAPGTGRSFARALVLGLTLYVPLLWPVLFASMAMIRWRGNGRSLHDLAGGTLVVADPGIDPERQRQMAMRMRLGRAA